ncbi:hypothetical protein HANVADRAFT_20997 [Hanseniaspora valbyensis NRRL Y-1626]|uniref:2-amino-4-hydroxy-6-hydroxymethyldihydropteridine diphosphokinase n=1 Tax=Hanseniaspora valbyensis NRRL Y-1626 TaxID=766949 RepID=A0A1B7TIU3_9ASCO|nr:hypothetical protein HANVADRAFT_20997 [Hanseniaspora valbyensis NRRL Y-1626]
MLKHFLNNSVHKFSEKTRFFSNTNLYYSTKNLVPVLHDAIYVEKLNINTVVGKNLWNIKTKQRMQVSLQYSTDFTKSSDQDDLSNTLNYAVLSKGIMVHLENNSYDNIFQLNKNLVKYLENNYGSSGKKIDITLDTTLLESHIRTNSVTLRYDTKKGTTIVIKNLRVLTYIGVFTFERLQKQYMDLELHISLKKDFEKEDNELNSVYDKFDIHKLVYSVVNFLESSNFKTVETLVNDTSNVIMAEDKAGIISKTKVKVIKPQAILQCETGVGVSCIRTPENFTLIKKTINKNEPVTQESDFNLPIPATKLPPKGGKFKVYLSLGTNQGDKLANIQTAINFLQKIPEISKILKVSSIYKSMPMYFTDQSQFYNLALSLETTLQPIELLKKLKEIEYDVLHRVKLFDNGPRPIDLDIIYYMHNGKHILVNDPTLIVPHKLMLERGFVLLPLTEILDIDDSVHPVSFEPVQNQLEQIRKENGLDLERVTPLDIGKEIEWHKGKTNIMNIVNVTSDSFSDGSVDPSEFISKLETLKKTVGGNIVDIGGCSTNPKSIEQISEKEEIERINSIINLVDREHFIVSLDSYRINVIENFIEKIDIINDIGFDFYGKVDRLSELLVKYPGKCYILNHVPGNSIHELKKIETSKAKADPKISEIVANDLLKKFNYLLSKGVNASQIILDPGIGFGKKTKENFGLIKNFKKNWNEISNEYKDIPVLFGYSRKRFLNIGDESLTPVERDFEGCILLTEIARQSNVMVRTHNIDLTNRTLAILKKLE